MHWIIRDADVAHALGMIEGVLKDRFGLDAFGEPFEAIAILGDKFQDLELENRRMLEHIEYLEDNVVRLKERVCDGAVEASPDD